MEVAVSSAAPAPAPAVVLIGEDVGAAVVEAPAVGGEEDGAGAEKNDVMLFCFCFLPVLVEAGEMAPGSLRLSGADILDRLIRAVLVYSLWMIDVFFCG